MKRDVNLIMKSFYLKFCVLLILSFLLISVPVSAVFSSSDGKTWNEGAPKDFGKITAEDMSKNQDYLEANWNKFVPKQKNDFISNELKKTLGYEVKVENLGSLELKYSKGILRDKDNAVFDIKNPPKGLKKITYDNKKGFIYDFGDGSIIEMKKGGLNKDKEAMFLGTGFLGMSKDISKGVKYESGKVSFDGEKFSLTDANSKISLDGKTYSLGNTKTNPGIVKVIEKDIVFGSNVISNYLGNAIFNIPNEGGYLIYKAGDFSKSDYAGKYFQIYDKNLVIDANSITKEQPSVNILKSFDLVSVSGSDEVGVKVFNGESKNFGIEFKGKNTNIPTQIKEMPFDIALIENQKNGIIHSLTTKEGVKVLTDEKKTTMVGKLIVNYLGIAQNFELGAAFIGSMKTSQIDFEKIPKGMNEQQYYKWIAGLDQKSLETQINIPITKEMIQSVRDSKISGTIGNENYEVLKTMFGLASSAGIIPNSDSSKIEGKLNNVRSATRLLNLGAGLAGNLGIIDKKYVDLTEKAAVAPDLGIAGAKFNDGVNQFFNTYDNKIPSGTKFNLYIQGDNARVTMVPPDNKMKPVEFTMERKAANYLFGEIIPKYPRLSGWNSYKK